MINTIEIELRYEIIDKDQLAQFVAPLQKIQHQRDCDIYYDTKDALLYQKGIFIRNRNNKKFDFKFNRMCLENPDLAIQDYCEEHSFALPLQEKDLFKINGLLVSLNLQSSPFADLNKIIKVNNFIEHYKVDKVRTSYIYNNFTVAVDEVTDLGTFLEVELMSSTIENLEMVKKEMEYFLTDLTLHPLKTGYGTLLLRKKDFKHYLLGRFILEEDKIYRKDL